jgi:hypothetical protein
LRENEPRYISREMHNHTQTKSKTPYIASQIAY